MNTMTEKWVFEEKNVFWALSFQTVFVGRFSLFLLWFFFFCMFSIQILPSGSPETVFLKWGKNYWLQRYEHAPHTWIFSLLYQQFSLSVSFFELPMEVYKPAMFLQTPLSQTHILPSSLFQDLIEKFPPVGWKKQKMLDAGAVLLSLLCCQISFHALYIPRV